MKSFMQQKKGENITKINKIILEALRRATTERGGQATLARKAGLADSYITRYLDGTIKSITLENWQKLEPHLRPYLPENYVSLNGSSSGNILQNSGAGLQNVSDSGTSLKHLTDKVIDSDDFDAETKLKIIKLINDN